MKIGELIMELGFQSDMTELNDFIGAIGKLDMTSLMAATGLGGLYEVTKMVMGIATDTAMEMNKFGVITGMSSQKMKAWENAAQKAGTAGGSLTSAIKNIQMIQTLMKRGVVNQDFLAALNLLNTVGADVDPYDDMFTILEKMRAVWGDIADGSKRDILNLMGANEELSLFLSASEDIYELRNKSAVANQADVEKLVHTWSQIKDIATNFGTVMTKAGAEMATVLNPVLELVNSIFAVMSKIDNFGSKVLKTAFPASFGLGSHLSDGKNLISKMFNDPVSLDSSVQGSKESSKTMNATFNVNGNDVKKMIVEIDNWWDDKVNGFLNRVHQ